MDTFPWGQATCWTATKKMDLPFNSFPAARGTGSVVERVFILQRGYLSFHVGADQDAELKPIIWECMGSLRRP